MGKRGPVQKWAVDGNRDPVPGLVLRTDGRYVAGAARNKTFGKDRDDAIRRFLAWQSRQKGATVTIAEIGPPTATVRKEWEQYAAEHPDPDAREYYRQALQVNETTKLRTVPDAAFWATVRKLITENPKLVARKTGIEEIGYLTKLEPPAPSMTLIELGNLYQSKREITDDWKRKARLFWQEFVNAVKVTTISEIAPQQIEAYEAAVFDANQSPTYAKQRFGLIKTVFAYALKRGRDQQEIRRVLDLLRMLIPPKANGKNPKPISPENFKQLLAVSNSKWQAIFLLSLNAALYPSEVAAVKTTDIDLDNATLQMERRKTGIHRVAVLWKRTIDAIRTYQPEFPHKSEYLFVSEKGRPYNGNHIARNFRRRREIAELPESLEFAHIRDGAETAAIEGGADLTQARLLAGHRTGISDHYVRRNPRMVADACQAIHKHYFGE